LARIEKKEKVVFEGKTDDWTTEDMIHLQDYEAEKNREILGVRLTPQQDFWLVDSKFPTYWKKFAGRTYKFYSLWKNMLRSKQA